MHTPLPHDREAVRSVAGDSPELREYQLRPLSVQVYDGHVGVVHYSYTATVAVVVLFGYTWPWFGPWVRMEAVIGTYVLSGLIQDPEAIHFFGRWIPGLEAWVPPFGG